MAKLLDRALLERALTRLGEELRERKITAEIAIFGGAAMLLQFGNRPSTGDVDIKLRTGEAHGTLMEAARRVADELDLPRGWLNEGVSVYLSANQPEEAFVEGKSYPSDLFPHLRVLQARPEYLLPMKLLALERSTRDDRDYKDAFTLGQHLGLTTDQELLDALARFYPGEELKDEVRARIRDLADDLYAASLSPKKDS